MLCGRAWICPPFLFCLHVIRHDGDVACHHWGRSGLAGSCCSGKMLDTGQMLTADPLPGGQESASVSLTKNSVSNKLLLRVGLSRETKKAGLIDSPGSHRHTHNAFGRVIKISCQSHLNLRTMKFRFCFLQAQSRDTRSLNLTYFKVVIICVCGGGLACGC